MSPTGASRSTSRAICVGLKIRTPPDRVRVDTFKALGAEPAPLAFGELYAALQQGLFDAQENPLSIIFTSSFFEVQRYLSMTGHVWGGAHLIGSKRVLIASPRRTARCWPSWARNGAWRSAA